MTHISYSALLRRNRNVRLLWAGQVVSQLGDWFNAVAVYALLLDLTGSATVVATLMVVQMIPTVIVGPFAGVLVDRYDRRRVMVAMDLVRGVVVLGLPLVRDATTVWVAYAVTAVAVVAQAFFEPARSAILPGLTSRDELLPANALSSATWSTMLAIGAAAGGAVAAIAGREAAFIINSLSFFASAAFLARIRQQPARETDATADVPWSAPGRAHDRHASSTSTSSAGAGTETTDASRGAATPSSPERVSGLKGLVEGVRFARTHPGVAALLSVKAAWAIAGGVLLLLTVYGERVFPVGSGAAAGIGLLYAARGVGSGAGALLTRRLVSFEPHRMRRVLGPAYAVIGVFYLALGAAPNIWLACLAVAGAHAAGALLWVASTVLLQIAVPDAFRGRVFAIDYALLTLVVAIASYVTGVGLDRAGIGPRALTAALGGVFFVPACIWMLATRRQPAPA